MRSKVLSINEVDVTAKPVVYTCYGLGSCIGLFLTDRLRGISGGAHIPLPDSNKESEWLGVSGMIDIMLENLKSMGSNLNCLRAKMTGGAHVLETMTNIGDQNVQSVLQQLMNRKIYLAAKDVGGKVSRTARFNSVTGELKISTSECKTYSI